MKAEGPYFAVAGDPSLDALPLKSTKVDVRPAGVIADVTVTQRYTNEGQRPIEARYVFPARRTPRCMRCRCAWAAACCRTRRSRRKRARIRHETARREGKTSALLEQERPNVFQMNVANILPGDDVQVELHYTELVVPTEGRYEFVFPTVVGPRYHRSASAGGTSRFPATAHLKEGEASRSAFDLHVHFASPLPVSELRSATWHRGQRRRHGRGRGGTRRCWRAQRPRLHPHVPPAGERTATGLTLFRGDGSAGAENFFLAVVEPPKAIAPAQINPREYVFVVDISGSMHGQPLATAKGVAAQPDRQPAPERQLQRAALLRQQPDAQRRAGAGHARQHRTRHRGDRPGARRRLHRDRAGAQAHRRAARRADVARSVIVVTDGYVTVENEVFALVRRNLGNSNVFAFGIGRNRHLIEGIARAGQGEPFIVIKPEFAAAQAERLRKMIDSPVLTHLQARFDGLDVYDLEPASLTALPDVLGGRPVVIQGKWRGEPRGQLVLEGRAAQGLHVDVVPVAAPDAQAGALRQLWARSRIQQLSDQEALEGGSGQREAITALGLRYSLLTQYTSFIAVDGSCAPARPPCR